LASLNQVIDGLDGLIGQAVRKLTVNATRQLRKDNPVDTGFSRSNWIPSIGAPYKGRAGERKVGKIDDSVQLQGAINILSYKLVQGNTYIANNVSYVPQLNNGSSGQAPRGYIPRALNKTIAKTVVKQ
jgi:hypothetical protein